MSVGVDFYQAQFLFQTFDTEVVWSWDLTDDSRAMFYNVVPAAVPAMEYARVEVTQTVQRGSMGIGSYHNVVELTVKLDFAGPESKRNPLNLGLLNFYAIRVPGD